MPRWVKWSLGVVGGLIATLLLAVVVFVLVFDWNWARGPITRAIETATDRQATIGNIDGEWSLRPRIAFDDIHFANAAWGDEAEMVSAERVEIVIDLLELLRGRVVLPEIALTRPKVVLERQEDGTSNWTFGAKQAADAVTPENRFEVPLIGRLTIEDGTLVYRDAASGLELDGEISTAVGSGGEGKTQVRLAANGHLKEEPFTLRVTGGSLLMLRETDQPYPLTVELDAGPSHARVAGSLQDPIKMEGLDLAVRLTGPNLARLSRLTGVPLPLTPVYDVEAQLYLEEGLWILRDMKGTMGHSDLAGSLKIDTRGERPYLEADLTSDTLDYRDVGSLIGVGPRPTGATDPGDGEEKQGARGDKTKVASGTATKPADDAAAEKPSTDSAAQSGSSAAGEQQQRRVLPDAPLAVEQVRNTDAVVKFRGKQVVAPNVPLSGVALDLQMRDGILRIQPLSVGVAGGKTVAEIKIDATGEMVQTEYDVRLQGYELGRFLSDAGLKDAGRGKIYGRILLEGPGDTLQKSLANANGNIRLVMYGGEISTVAMEIAGIDIFEGLGLLAGGDKPTVIRCMAADMPVKSGTIETNFFVFDTEDSTVTLDGTASLAAERLDMRMRAHPKDVSALTLRTPITITGPFARPNIGVNAGPLAARAAGAVALGTLLTPLAALLAFIEPGLEKDNDCAQLLKDAKPD